MKHVWVPSVWDKSEKTGSQGRPVESEEGSWTRWGICRPFMEHLGAVRMVVEVVMEWA